MSTTKHHSTRGGVIVDTFVEHYTAGGGTAASTDRYMRDVAGNSAHAIVDRAGDIREPVDLDRAAWHAGDHNRAYTRGSRFPSASQLADLASGARTIIPIGVVPYRRRIVNQRSVGIEHCNRGSGYAAKGDAFFGRHRNPASKDGDWEPYTDAAIATSIAFHERALAAVPSIKYVTGHEDLCHADALGDDPNTPQLERKAGAKLDPGPAFPWDALLAPFVGRLRRVWYDFGAHGWRMSP